MCIFGVRKHGNFTSSELKRKNSSILRELAAFEINNLQANMQCPEEECLCNQCRVSRATQMRNENYNFVDNQSRNLKNLCTVIKREGLKSRDKKNERCISLDRLANSVSANPDGIISLCWLGRHRNVLDFSDEDLINQGKKCKIYLVGENCSVKVRRCPTKEDDVSQSCSEENLRNISNENFVGNKCEPADFYSCNCSCSFHHQYICPITHDSIPITNNELCQPIDAASNVQFENNQLLDEMLSLCETLHAFGYEVSDEPEMKAITYGELYELYLFKNLDHEKMDLASICFLARQHCLIQFEGDCLSIPNDEELALFLVRNIEDVRKLLGFNNVKEKYDNISNVIEKERSADQISQIIKNVGNQDLNMHTDEKPEDRHSNDIDINNFQPIAEKIMSIDNNLVNEPERSESPKRFEELNNYCKSAYQCASALLDNPSIQILITCQKQEEGECGFLVGENRTTHCNFSNIQSQPQNEFKSEYSQTDEAIREATHCQTDFEEEPKTMSDPFCHCRRKPTNDRNISTKDIYDTHAKSDHVSKLMNTTGNKPIENNKKIETSKDNFICHCSQLEISVSQHRSRSHERENFKKGSISKPKSTTSNNIENKNESRRDRSSSRPRSRSNKVNQICANDVRKSGGNSRSHSKNRLETSQSLKQSIFIKPPSSSKQSTTKNDLTKSLKKDSEKTSNTFRIDSHKLKCDLNTSTQYSVKPASNRLRSGYSSNELSLNKMLGNISNIPKKLVNLNFHNKKSKTVKRNIKSSHSIKCDVNDFHVLKPNLQMSSHFSTPNVFIYQGLPKNKNYKVIDETKLQGKNQDKNAKIHINVFKRKHQTE